MIPQLIYLALVMINLAMTMAKHGEPKKGKENAWGTFIGILIVLPILYWGGFFNPLF